MIQNNEFVQATSLFHLGQFQEGLMKITNCIQSNPKNSMLYSNRALFYYQLKDYQNAMRDLQISIQQNYLNYIAYFNLFSIQLGIGNLQGLALQDLCCSISILYFLRGKEQKSQLDIEKSLKYCQNNIQAHILKGMMHLQKNKIKLAQNQIQWALQYQPNNIVLKRLRMYVSSKIDNNDSQQQQDEQQNQQQQQNDKPAAVGYSFRSTAVGYSFRRKRLQCSLEIDEGSEILIQINEKLLQFTQVYNSLNQSIGTVTQRILLGDKIVVDRDRQDLLQDRIAEQCKIVSGIIEERSITHIRGLNKHSSSQIEQNSQPQDDQDQQKDNHRQFIQHNQQQNDAEGIYKDNDYLSINHSDQNNNYFIMNQRQDFLNTFAHQEQKQQSFDIPYALLNNKFAKVKKECKVQQVSTQSRNENQLLNMDNQQRQQFHQQNDGQQQFIIRQQFHNSILLPEPFQQVILQEQQVIVDHFNHEYSQQQQTNFKDNYQRLQPFNQKPSSSSSSFIIELQQTGNTQHITDPLSSQQILSYSSSARVSSSYREILTKSNQNIEFHQSQIVQGVECQNERNHENYENDQAQITLIDDLLSETSQKNKQEIVYPTTQTTTIDQQKKDLIRQRHEQIKQKVTKSSPTNTNNLLNQKIQIKTLLQREGQSTQFSQKNEHQTETVTKSQSQNKHILLYNPFIKRQIYFTFTQVQLSKHQSLKITQLQQLYLVATYHLSIPKYKMKTQARKVTGLLCVWNEKFPQLSLLEQVRNVKISVFSKAKGMKNRDLLIGEVEKEVSQTGVFRLILKQNKIVVGHVSYEICYA